MLSLRLEWWRYFFGEFDSVVELVSPYAPWKDSDLTLLHSYVGLIPPYLPENLVDFDHWPCYYSSPNSMSSWQVSHVFSSKFPWFALVCCIHHTTFDFFAPRNYQTFLLLTLSSPLQLYQMRPLFFNITLRGCADFLLQQKPRQ